MTMHNSNCNDNDKKEWMRRRQIRLVQVRKQSDDIAKRLRQRVSVEQEQRRIEKEHELERKLTLWKMKRLKDLEQLYRNAITEIGTGHQMAMEEQNNDVISSEKQKENNFKAKERGDLALEYELKLKKEATNKKLIPVQRKKLTRQIEDLRSCLVRSILFKEKSKLQRDFCTEKQLQKKLVEGNVETEKSTKGMNQTLEHKTGKLDEICSKKTTDNCFQVEKPSCEKQNLKVQNKVNELKNCTESHSVKPSTTAHRKAEKLWIDLGKLENRSVEKLSEGEDKDNNSSCLRITEDRGKIVRTGNEKQKNFRRHAPKYNEGKKVTTPSKQSAKVVECYDYSLRHNCTSKEGAYSVCRIDDKIEQPDANELARLEEKELEQEKQEKESKIILAEKRGNKAIEKERINRSYRQLLTKLEKLGAKEKLIKSYCHIPPPDAFMSDERRSEKAVRKQRIMDSKFEQIYYDVMGVNADADLKSELYFGPYNRPVNPEKELEGLVTKLDFSELETNLKPNSPASSPRGSEKSEVEPPRPATEKLVINKTPSSFHFKRTKFKGCDERVLSEIDQILEKSRKLRRESERNRKGRGSEHQSVVEDDRINTETGLDVKDGGSEDSLGSVSLSSELCGSLHFSPCGDGATNGLCGIKEPSNKPAEVMPELGMGDLTREFPAVRNTAIVWPVQQMKGKNTNDSCGGWSSATSYRSLPPEIHPNRVTNLLKLLAKLKEEEGCSVVTEEFTLKLETLLNSLVKETEESCADTCKEESREFQFNPQLNYYITKLLDMSRERVANLNVTSESETSLMTKPTNCSRNDRGLTRSNQTGRSKTFNETSDDSRCERMQRAKELEKMIKRLSNVLEKYLRNYQETDKVREISDPEATERYEDCSSGTAVRADESRFLSERVANCSGTSGNQEKCSRSHSKSLVSKSRDGRTPRGCEDSNFKDQRTFSVHNQPAVVDYCDDNNCPYKAGKTADQECQVEQSHGASLECLPDVMEELMKKNILTSPFQWDSGIPLSDVSCLPEDVADRPDNNLEDCKKRCAHGLQPYKCADSCKGVCAGSFAYKCLESCKGVCAGSKMNSNSGSQAGQKLNECTVRKKYVFRNAKERDAVLGMFSPIDISPSQRRTSDIGPEEELEIERQKQRFIETRERMAKRFCSSKEHPPIYEGYPEKRPVLNVHIDTPSFRKVKNCPVDECSVSEYDTADCSAAGESEGSRTKKAQSKDAGLPFKYFQPCSDNSEENDSPIGAACVKNKRSSSPKNECHPEKQKTAQEPILRGSSECPAVTPCRSSCKKRTGSPCSDFREGNGDGTTSCRPEMNTRSFDNEPPMRPSTAGQTAREHFAKKKHVFRSAQERDAVLGMFSPIDIPPCQRRTSDIDSEEEMEIERQKQRFAETKERMAKKFCSSKRQPPMCEGYPEKRPVLNVHIDTPSFRKKDRHSDGPNETAHEKCEFTTPVTQKGTQDGYYTFTVDKKTSGDVSAANATRTICKGRRSNSPDGCATRTIFNPQFADHPAGGTFEECQDSSVPFVLNLRTAKDRDAAFGIYSPIGGNPADRDTSRVTDEEAILMKHMRQLSREKQQRFGRAQVGCTPKTYPPLYEGYPDKRPVLNVHIDTPSFRKKDCCPADGAEEENCPKSPNFLPATLAPDQMRTCLCTKMGRAYERSAFVGGSCNSQQQDAPTDVLAISQPEEQEQTCLNVGENLNVSGDAKAVASEPEEKDNSDEGAVSNEITYDLRCSIQRDFEFLKGCASHMDREVLYNLLLSQMHNSKRLKTIMRDMLHIPNAEILVDEFLNGTGSAPEVDGVQHRKSREYAQQIKEMFPDADERFLARECDGLENEADFLRFVNTVMLSGSYVKEKTEEAKKFRDGRNSDDEAPNRYRSCVVYSSDEEFVYERPCRRAARKTKPRDEQVPRRRLAGKTKPRDEQVPRRRLAGKVKDEQEEREEESEDQDEQESLSARKNYVDKVISLDEFLKSWSLICEGGDGRGLVDNSEDESGASGGPVGLRQSGRLPLLFRDESGNIVLAERESGRESENSAGAISRAAENVEGVDGDSEDELVDQPGQEDWIDEKTAELMRLFPNTDPTYLRAECAKFEGSLDAMNEFVISKLEKNDMPTIAEYEKRREMEELQDRYTKNFSIEDFLRVIPQPWEYFNNYNRNCKKYKAHSLAFLGRTFTRLSMAAIREVFFKNKRNLYRTYKELSKVKAIRQHPLRLSTYKEKAPSTINIQFLQEVAFIQNEQKIKNFMEAREVERMRKLEEARKSGSLLECQCCFDSEVMVDDAVYCPKDHCFCKNCLVKLVEIEMGQANYQFTCLAGCGEKYTLSSLQQAVSPEVFSKVLRAIQMEEIKAAGIEDLVQCPFCNYATIMPPDVKIVACLNPECQKESCRLCQELSHVPLRCDEVEKSEEVKMRTYIENKMTEALIRRCYKCGKAFVKEEGCNKMQCSCGAKMCYVCRKPVSDYSHFNGQGGTEYQKCPLYSTNDELHVDLVEKVAEQAKAEILKANPDKTLKHDPTMVLPERTYDDPMPGMNRGAGLVAGLLDIRPRQGIDRLDPVRQPHQQAAGPRAPATNRPQPHLQQGNHRGDLARQALERALFRLHHD